MLPGLVLVWEQLSAVRFTSIGYDVVAAAVEVNMTLTCGPMFFFSSSLFAEVKVVAAGGQVGAATAGEPRPPLPALPAPLLRLRQEALLLRPLRRPAPPAASAARVAPRGGRARPREGGGRRAVQGQGQRLLPHQLPRRRRQPFRRQAQPQVLLRQAPGVLFFLLQESSCRCGGGQRRPPPPPPPP